MKTLRYFLFAVVATTLFVACSGDDLSPNSIFDTSDTAPFDRNDYTYKLDSFCYVNYLQQYNLRFLYRMEDVGTDLNYNLVPSTYEKSKQMAVLAKYLWFDVYDKIASPDFLKENGPRIIHLIGSPAYNPASGTIILGLAEGGLKVSLFRVNELTATNAEMLNEYYFKTMHHEFSHILHQAKPIPKAFNMLSYKDYNPLTWQDRHEYIAFSLGFASSYGSSEMREDWVEIIANYIVKTDAWWNNTYAAAAKGWKQIDKDNPNKGVTDIEDYEEPDIAVKDTCYKVLSKDSCFIKGDTLRLETGEIKMLKKTRPIPDTDGVDGRAILKQKIDMCRDWMKNQWGIDLDALRAEVQYRQSHINMKELLKQVE